MALVDPQAFRQDDRYGALAQPEPGFHLDVGRAALVITDPQVDFLSPRGAIWDAVGQSVDASHTVQNIECLESHLRALIERGFEVAVVRDATAAARLPDGDGYLAAMINFRYLANALWSTDEAVGYL